MKKIILLSTFLSCLMVVSSASAEDYICPVDNNYMSNLFKNNWQYLPDRQIYFSYVELPLAGNSFRGTLHTLTTKLSEDSNPHLAFAHLKLSLVRERHAWQIDCQYKIGNSTMADLYDGYLHLSSVVTLDKKCRQVSNTTVTCS